MGFANPVTVIEPAVRGHFIVGDKWFTAEVLSGELAVDAVLRLRRVEYHAYVWRAKGSLVKEFGTTRFRIVRATGRWREFEVEPVKTKKGGR